MYVEEVSPRRTQLIGIRLLRTGWKLSFHLGLAQWAKEKTWNRKSRKP